jgi:AcrR family transcriptional regulator
VQYLNQCSLREVVALLGKKKEIQAREAYFIDVARGILLREGYQGVSINRIAEETGFSKGTVYQRFASKEELITAIGLECRATLLETIQKGASFPGCPRERMLALGEALVFYSKYQSDNQRILKIIDAEAILQKVPEGQQAKMKRYDIQVFLTVLEIIEEAITKGDLVLKGDKTSQGLCFTFWAMMDGSFDASMGGAPLQEVGIDNPTAEVVRNCHYLMDGYGWRPLYSECDYEAITRRIRTHLMGEPLGDSNLAAVEDGNRPDSLRKKLESGGTTVLSGQAFSLVKGGV